MTETGAFTWQYAVGAIGFAVTFIAIPLAVIVAHREWQRYVAWNREQAQRHNLTVHRGLHPNVRVLPEQRSAR